MDTPQCISIGSKDNKIPTFQFDTSEHFRTIKVKSFGGVKSLVPLPFSTPGTRNRPALELRCRTQGQQTPLVLRRCSDIRKVGKLQAGVMGLIPVGEVALGAIAQMSAVPPMAPTNPLVPMKRKADISTSPRLGFYITSLQDEQVMYPSCQSLRVVRGLSWTPLMMKTLTIRLVEVCSQSVCQDRRVSCDQPRLINLSVTITLDTHGFGTHVFHKLFHFPELPVHAVYRPLDYNYATL